jgi:hypothetical protein
MNASSDCPLVRWMLRIRPLFLSPSDEMAICVEGGVARARLMSLPEEEEGNPGRFDTKRGKRRHVTIRVTEVDQARTNVS